MKKLYHILLSMILLMTVVACDVHEFPADRGELVPFTLHLDFDTEMPLYEVIPYETRSVGSVEDVKGYTHDVRYIINVYRDESAYGQNRYLDTTFVFTKSDLYDLNYTAHLELHEGAYIFRVWADYVTPGTVTDKYYNTSNFADIMLTNRENHAGSNDYRDAFRGEVRASVYNTKEFTPGAAAEIDNSATVPMDRPMGKYVFISTDLNEFITRVLDMMREKGELPEEDDNGKGNAPSNEQGEQGEQGEQNEQGEQGDQGEQGEQGLKGVNLDDFTIEFVYMSNMISSYNLFEDCAADVWGGVRFKSKMRQIGSGEVEIGFDYVFVNGDQTKFSVVALVYDKDNELLSQSEPVAVTLMRSQLTEVRGKFLTSEAKGGVSIDPGYAGDDIDVFIDDNNNSNVLN